MSFDLQAIDSMKLFGFIMILLLIQLFVVGSIIQRGKQEWLFDFQKKGIVNMPLYCRLFGNRLILLGIIAGVCAYISMNATEVSMKPIIVFGIGILLVFVLMLRDHARCSK